MQIAVFGSRKENWNEHEKENARIIGRQLTIKGMGPLLVNVDSELAREVAWGARKHSDRMLIIGTLPTERDATPKEISSPKRPYSATYFTNTPNKIRSCSAAIFIGNGPDVLEALIIAYNHAPEGFVIGIFDDANSLSKELATLVERSGKETLASIVKFANPVKLVNAIFNELMHAVP